MSYIFAFSFHLLVGLYICTVLHELGHALIMKTLGLRIQSIEFGSKTLFQFKIRDCIVKFGVWPEGRCTTATDPVKKTHMLAILGAGIAANLLCIALLYLLMQFAVIPKTIAVPYISANIILVIINTLPVTYFTDGYLFYIVARAIIRNVDVRWLVDHTRMSSGKREKNVGWLIFAIILALTTIGVIIATNFSVF
ncbi:site-2 protease family protein [Desulfurispora thermophila]|uniref:site-2 protease family protein n=1 Tax=Desulfurispora thermophila TaxID=265470 RepID=UPI00037A3312